MSRIRFFCAAALMLSSAAVHAANTIEVTVDIFGTRWQVGSDASVTLYNSSGNVANAAYIRMTHDLYSTNRHQASYPTGFGRIFNSLTNTASTGSTLPAGCNYARVYGQSYDPEYPATGKSARTNDLCWEPLEPPAPYRQIAPCDEPGCSPIVLPLDGAYALTGPADGVAFDLNADGVRERLSWTSPARLQPFLALDRNGNGTIDDGRELFGTFTPLRSGANAPNGFIALAELDLDGNGAIDAADAAWTALLLWDDANHDGVSDPGELTKIAESDVASVRTDHAWSGRRDEHGNTFRYRSTMELRRARASSSRAIYDVFFVPAN